ncbi:uncharacterized protein LOC122856723 [Aphidius gifuensis]|uniref:uncharacterized protein LOC122856723 n=1 Tax=Aphidius gifuensis TaxID=684658 RepID=UPI001CDBA277|nr:uncharacterized protein LOC122856723 [Aphidius gifuensis]
MKKYTLNQIRHSFWTWTGRICDICLCYLDQINMPNSIRKISMEPVVASSGAIVTGIKWIIEDDILCLKIQEGNYINGSIYNENLNWLGAENIKDKIILNANLRSFSLEDFILPEGSLVAGLI